MSLIDLLQQQYENPVSESETLSPEEIETYTKVASAFCEQNDIDFDSYERRSPAAVLGAGLPAAGGNCTRRSAPGTRARA